MNKYYSQAKQDKFIFEKIIKKKTKGFFVEIGAFDGITISNTLFFEKYLNWDGICVEPIKKYYENILKNRKCLALNLAISNYDGKTNFNYVEDYPMFSGIESDMPKSDINKLKKEYNFKNIEVEVISFKNFIKKTNIKKISYLSIDTEGNELKILKDIPFNEIFIDIISVEDNHNLKKVDKILKENGFVLIRHSIFDKIFINKKSKYYTNNLIFLRLKASILNLYVNSSIDKKIRPIINKNKFLRKILIKYIHK